MDHMTRECGRNKTKHEKKHKWIVLVFMLVNGILCDDNDDPPTQC